MEKQNVTTPMKENWGLPNRIPDKFTIQTEITHFWEVF
jgi:hypothetical protein